MVPVEGGSEGVQVGETGREELTVPIPNVVSEAFLVGRMSVDEGGNSAIEWIAQCQCVEGVRRIVGELGEIRHVIIG